MTDLINDTITATLAGPAPGAAADLVADARTRNAELQARGRAEIARAKLEGYLAQYQRSGQAAARRVFTEVPSDALVRATAMRWSVSSRGELLVGWTDADAQPLHRHAVYQVAERIGMSPRYLFDLLAKGTEWARELVAHCMSEHSTHDDGRYLVRAAGGSVRGVLSDKYRRLDSRPLLETFLVEAERAGMQVAAGISTDVRTALKVVVPEIVTLPDGDLGIFGLNWTNSDYGAGKYSVDAFLLRLLCLNGLVGENSLGAVHLGRRISDSAVVSQQTIDLDTQTLQSATRDVVRGIADNGAIRTALLGKVEAAAQARISGDPIRGRLQTTLSSSEQKRVRELFKGPEVVLLPPEPTRWRLSNAISWMANEEEDGGRKIELERLAGEILDATKARDVVARDADTVTMTA